MSYQVIEEQLNAVRHEAIETLKATRQVEIDPAHFDWLYRDNPDGEAVFWSIREDDSSQLVGFTVALPRRVLMDGEVRMCWNCADFSILPKYRTLGIAIKLRRAAKEGIDAGRVDFLYAHPNEKMAVIHSRVGHVPLGNMIRFAKVLRTASYLQNKISTQTASALLGNMIDPVLSLTGKERRHRSKYDLRLVSPACFDERFNRLFAESKCSNRIIGVRDAKYLKWRYEQNPLSQSHVLLAEDGGSLRGYLVFTIEDDVASFKDLFPPDDTRAMEDLIVAWIGHARKNHLSGLNVTLLEGNSLTPILEKFGFRQRPDSSQMFVYTSQVNERRETIMRSDAWFSTVGDRDV